MAGSSDFLEKLTLLGKEERNINARWRKQHEQRPPERSNIAKVPSAAGIIKHEWKDRGAGVKTL